jgi:hypothetical protein
MFQTGPGCVTLQYPASTREQITRCYMNLGRWTISYPEACRSSSIPPTGSEIVIHNAFTLHLCYICVRSCFICTAFRIEVSRKYCSPPWLGNRDRIRKHHALMVPYAAIHFQCPDALVHTEIFPSLDTCIRDPYSGVYGHVFCPRLCHNLPVSSSCIQTTLPLGTVGGLPKSCDASRALASVSSSKL